MSMGGHRVPGEGTGDDGYDEEGYDESQRAEILEATRDGPSDGTILLDLAPDLGGDVEEPDEDDQTDLKMLDDELGEHGVRLSGGQRARLALARALCRRPRVLIVDEITASLDAESERIISDVLEGFDGTVIAASHRRETLGRFGRVVGVEREGAEATAGRPR